MTRALWLPEAIRAEGVTVKVVPGWRTRGRDFRGGRGVVHHHTAAGFSSSPTPSLRIVTEGTGSVPGPLAQLLLGRDLTCWVVAAGRANHAGLGGPWRTVPKDSANEYMIGLEVENNGVNERWSASTLDTCTRIFAAVLKRQKRDASWLIGHKEWAPTRKIDPWCCDPGSNVQMNQMRLQVKDYLAGGGDDDMSYQEFEDGLVWAMKNPDKPIPDNFPRAKKMGVRVRREGREGRHPHPYAAVDHGHGGEPGGPHSHPDLATQGHTHVAGHVAQSHVHETGPAKG